MITPSPPLPLLLPLCLLPSLPHFFERRVTPLEAAEQRNCLLSRVDFSCACKLLCIDTLSERGRHTGSGHSPPHGRATDLGVLPPGLRGSGGGTAWCVCVCVCVCVFVSCNLWGACQVCAPSIHRFLLGWDEAFILGR